MQWGSLATKLVEPLVGGSRGLRHEKHWENPNEPLWGERRSKVADSKVEPTRRAQRLEGIAQSVGWVSVCVCVCVLQVDPNLVGQTLPLGCQGARAGT